MFYITILSEWFGSILPHTIVPNKIILLRGSKIVGTFILFIHWDVKMKKILILIIVCGRVGLHNLINL